MHDSTKQIEAAHTPEPWRYGPCEQHLDGSVRMCFHLRDHHGYLIDLTYTDANGLRAVACVNACKGINPEAVPDMLSALKRLLSGNDMDNADDWNVARTAIAKAEGRQ